MKDFENIGKRMPYDESPGYVDQLVGRVTENAIHHGGVRRSRSKMYFIISAAAMVLLLVGLGVLHFHQGPQPVAQTTVQTSPIDEFLNGLTDEEAQALSYYEIEEIPEY